MRISDWSSDVCSSDLSAALVRAGACEAVVGALQQHTSVAGVAEWACCAIRNLMYNNNDNSAARSEERRVGKSVSVRVDLGGRRIIKTKKIRQVKISTHQVKNASMSLTNINEKS